MMKTYMNKVGKTLLLGLIILAIGLIPIWLIAVEAKESDLMFYIGFIIIIVIISIGVITDRF